ncbi:2-dehydro-3-deoxygalactonokinase [Halomonas caseinilytica]|uniref:2-keto-3-deoxygalactonate kinase n=1 Tax=Halomonas caseinilytica TaxID=438744 RepID=A0A1M6YEV4_9GAMM|nr:2-dehydro-3-deoxygalactonokinase [Halomonas caseinilytica]SHL16509.1 2-keto-3-deoxygalactonate kinase [Halomonas caseinilytica]
MSERLIAIDWGTSNFRAFLVDRTTGECLDSHRSDAGLRSLSSEAFPHYCQAQVGAWRAGGRVPVYLSGMVGSARGWCEAPQLEVPASATQLAASVMAAPGLSNAWIVPGLKVVQDGHVDVMRGEEVQAFGSLTLRDTTSGLCCLPGTHSKWVRMEQDHLTDFTTAMTGELFHAVRFHTLPGEPSRDHAAFDETGFRQGLEAAMHPDGPLHALFEARSRHLHAGLAAEAVGGFLSGVLIGNEVLSQRKKWQDTSVTLVGSTALNSLYRIALEWAGGSVVEISSDDATLAGLCALARRHET